MLECCNSILAWYVPINAASLLALLSKVNPTSYAVFKLMHSNIGIHKYGHPSNLNAMPKYYVPLICYTCMTCSNGNAVIVNRTILEVTK